MTLALREQQGLSYRREQKGALRHIWRPGTDRSRSLHRVIRVGTTRTIPATGRTGSCGAEWTWEAGEPGPHSQDSTVASTNLATMLHVLPLLHRAVWHCAQHLEWSRWWDFKLELVVISFIYKGTSQRSQDFVVNLLHNQTLMPTHNCFKPRKDTNSLQRPELPNNLLTIFSKQGEVGLSRPKQVRLQSVPEGQDNVFEMHGMQLQKQCH